MHTLDTLWRAKRPLSLFDASSLSRSSITSSMFAAASRIHVAWRAAPLQQSASVRGRQVSPDQHRVARSCMKAETPTSVWHMVKLSTVCRAELAACRAVNTCAASCTGIDSHVTCFGKHPKYPASPHHTLIGSWRNTAAHAGTNDDVGAPTFSLQSGSHMQILATLDTVSMTARRV